MKLTAYILSGVSLLLAAHFACAERINHEGRILGPQPVVTNAVLFNTPAADAIVSALQIFPPTNPWNEDISRRPVLSNSDAMIAQISADLRSDRRSLIAFQEMNYVLVPDNQTNIPINFFDYADESELDGGTFPYGNYPIPANMPIEGWPSQTDGLTLGEWQQDINDDGGDRHAILVQPGTGFIREMWQARQLGTNWEASNGAKFDLKSNALRPAGWTSGDAAGLPMFPALPRFDECERGVVEHAMRIVVKNSRYNRYIYPATHWAAPTNNTSVNLPAMGQRVRLKAGFVIPAGWTKQEKAILTALKKYGAIVADNGNFFSISVTPDDRWPAGCFNHFTTIGITNFEVIQTTGANEGPRSGGAPVAYAGADRSVPLTGATMLQGFVSFTNPATVVQWKRYSGPGTVVFSNAAQTNATATFSAPGTYTLMLSAEDGVHAVAYDAVVLTVGVGGTPLTLSLTGAGTNANLSWSGGAAPYVIERSESLAPAQWSLVTTTSQQTILLPRTNSAGFYRVRGS